MEEIFNEYIDEERFDEALEFLIEHEYEFLDRGQTLFKKSWLLNRAERYEEALLVLKQLKDLGNEDLWYYSQLGYAKSRIQAYDEALDAFFKAKALGRDDAWIDTEIASVYAEMAYYEEAKDYFIQSFDKEPESILTNCQLAKTYFYLGDYKNSYDYYFNAYQLGRNDSLLLSELAMLCNKLQRQDEAIVYLDEIQRQGYMDDWCRLEYAMAYNLKGDYEKALDYLDQVEDTSMDGYLTQKGTALFSLHRQDEALDVFLKMEYKEPHIVMAIAHIYKVRQDYKEADDYYHEAYTMGVRSAILYESMAQTAMYYRKDYKASMNYLKCALELEPENASLIEEMGFNYELLGEIDHAIACYERCLNMKPTLDFATKQLVTLYDHRQQYQNSYAWLKHLETLVDTTDPQLIYTKARLLRKLKRPHEALETLSHIDEKNSLIYCEYGDIYMSLDQEAQAIAYFKQALEEDHTFQEPYIRLGDIYLNHEDYFLARDYYLKAVDAGEMNAYLAKQLARCSEGLNQSKEALAYYETCLIFDPTDDEAKKKMKKSKKRLLNIFPTK